MKNCKIYKVIGLSSVFMMVQISMVHSFFPTFDISEVSNTISTYSSQVESVSSTVNSTSSIGKMQQALGDSVGSMSKFVDKAAKADDLRQQAEKKAQRAQRLAELQDQWEKKYNDAQNMYDKGSSMYDKGSSAYETGQGAYNQVKPQESETVDSGTPTPNQTDNEQNAATQNQQNQETSGTSPTDSTSSGTSTDTSDVNKKPVSDLSGEAIDNEDIADLISDSEFSEGVWDGQAVSGTQETATDKTGEDNQTTTGEAGIRQPFVDKQVTSQEVLVTDGKTTVAEGEEAAIEGGATVDGMPTGEAGIRQPFVDKTLENTQQPVLDSAGENVDGATPTNTVPVVTAPAVTQPEGLNSNMVLEGTYNQSAIQDESNIITSVSPNDTLKSAVSDALSATDNQNAVQPQVSPSVGIRRPFGQPVNRLQEDIKVEEPKTQEVLKVSYVYRTSSAYAQVSCSSFKTGTTDEGKFIYSDIIANKCCLNFDELNEEKVAECVKTWVMGINDPNAEIATEWKDQYNNSLHDHVAADLNKALEQKNYSANFETDVADDLENKSEALTTEREEVSFAGNVNQVNQEIIIRLMEAMTGQVVTEAWSAVNTLERSYYEDAE